MTRVILCKHPTELLHGNSQGGMGKRSEQMERVKETRIRKAKQGEPRSFPAVQLTCDQCQCPDMASVSLSLGFSGKQFIAQVPQTAPLLCLCQKPCSKCTSLLFSPCATPVRQSCFCELAGWMMQPWARVRDQAHLADTTPQAAALILSFISCHTH